MTLKDMLKRGLVVFIIIAMLVLGVYAWSKFKKESFLNDADTEIVTSIVKNYTSSVNDVMGQPIKTPREEATLVGMPDNLGLIQSEDYNPSVNTDCKRLNDSNFMSQCPQSNPSFTVATSLLPKDTPESEWGVPDCVKNALQNQNYLSAAQRIGNNTTNGVLRNPSLDLRNEVPNPMTPVSIWNASTITPNLYKRDIE